MIRELKTQKKAFEMEMEEMRKKVNEAEIQMKTFGTLKSEH